jgi:glycosyltransferase involved in cell wall biosynthesis
VTNVLHLVHSVDPTNGGVAEAVNRLNDEMNSLGLDSTVSDNRDYKLKEPFFIIAHGLWQWPSIEAYHVFRKYKIPYLLFPHGMLDPWFKRTYRLKHIKKQIYWWLRQGKAVRNAKALCFTTEEERALAQKTFWPYSCKEIVTGLGVKEPPNNVTEQCATFLSQYPKLRDKKVLLYLGRFHPKKGVDLLIKSFSRKSSKNEVLVLAGPIDQSDKHLKDLQNLAKKKPQKIIWTGMLHGDLKWGALQCADALILPSHQENYGMVVAEALSVETPVFLTNKVNLWREVIDSNCGIVAQNDQNGIDTLIEKWSRNEHAKMHSNAGLCFKSKLHIQKTAKNICKVLELDIP